MFGRDLFSPTILQVKTTICPTNFDPASVTENLLRVDQSSPGEPGGSGSFKKSSVNNFQAIEHESVFGSRAVLRLQGFVGFGCRTLQFHF
jgi:hypothetical protein